MTTKMKIPAQCVLKNGDSFEITTPYVSDSQLGCIKPVVGGTVVIKHNDEVIAEETIPEGWIGDIRFETSDP